MKDFTFCFDSVLARNNVETYQALWRVYLDEYPEVVECDFRVNFDTSLLMKRFMVKE